MKHLLAPQNTTNLRSENMPSQMALPTSEKKLSMRDFVNFDYHCDRSVKIYPVGSSLNCLNSKPHFYCKFNFGVRRNCVNMFMQTAHPCSIKDASGKLLELESCSFLSAGYCGTHVLTCMQDFDVLPPRDVGADALDLICERLRAGQVVTFNNFSERLPFFLNFRLFEANYDLVVSIFPNFNLLIGISNIEIFYIKGPEDLNWRTLAPHPKNRYVVVIKKELLLPALKVFSEIYMIGIAATDIDFYTSQRYLHKFFEGELKARQSEISCLWGSILSCHDSLTALAEFLTSPVLDLFGECAIMQRSGAANPKTFLSWQLYYIVVAKQLQATALSYWLHRLESSAFVAISLRNRNSVWVWKKICPILIAVSSVEVQLGKRAVADAFKAGCDLERRLSWSFAAFLEEEVGHE